MHDDMHSGGGGNCVFLLIQSTPRKGTETVGALVGRAFHDDTIYTPQGDGNLHHTVLVRLPLRYNLHPARGRKRQQAGGQDGQEPIQSTPRKGTETGVLTDFSP